MDGNKINLLKSYFTAFQLNNELYSYADLARYLGVSTAIVKNVYNDRTVFPSKKLTKHLSERFNKNPEAILADIYESCFCMPSYKHAEIVAMSLYYNFGYSICFEEDNRIAMHTVKLSFINPLVEIVIPVSIRKTGPELKYTGVVAWEVIRRAFCCAHDNSPFAYKYDPNQPYKPYSNIESFLFAMTSGLYAILGSDIMAIYKKIIVVFNSECADEVEAYDQIRANLLDDSSRILPLLYDEFAQFSIRDVDMLNGIG